MKSINTLAFTALIVLSSCSNDDQPNPDLSNLHAEIITAHLNDLSDTDLVNLQASLINGSGENINYSEINWFSDKDGDLENRRFQDSYFLSSNHHQIRCEIRLSNDVVITETIQLQVNDDARGNWNLDDAYHGAGSEFYTHDGLVLETTHFTIYSNTTDPLKRLYISEFAEQSLTELKTLYSVNSFDFRGKVLIGHDKDDGRGFIGTYPHFSMFVGMPESGFVPLNGSWNFNIEGIKHELTHLVELSYLFSSPSEFTTNRWFWEGIAVLTSKGPRITTLAELTSWQNTNGGNPISIKDQPTGTSSSDGHYYPLFGLSAAYLVDPNGLGKSYGDIIEMYESIEQGASFESAFFSHFGITEDEYESNYFSIMENYLD